MQPTGTISKAARFFFDHAGWSYDPKRQSPAAGRTKCAEQLAEAEAAFFDVEAYCNWSFKVAPDFEQPHDDEGRPQWSMWIEDTDGRCVASLHAIDDDSTNYRRVVRAELASELLDEMREAVAAEREGV